MMPSATFESLDAEKKGRIRRALLEEFSQRPLSHAQVARIVQAAHISRGAFYVYFTDLADSYRWVLHQALDTIEDDLVAMMRATPDDSLQAFVNYTERYTAQLKNSPYRALYAMHWQCNEAYLSEVEQGKVPTQAAAEVPTRASASTPELVHVSGQVPVGARMPAQEQALNVMQAATTSQEYPAAGGTQEPGEVARKNDPSSDAHRFESITLAVQGNQITDRHITRVVVAMLATLTHQTVKDVLAGEDPATSMHNYATAVGIIRDGLIKQQEELSVSGHQGN